MHRNRVSELQKKWISNLRRIGSLVFWCLQLLDQGWKSRQTGAVMLALESNQQDPYLKLVGPAGEGFGEAGRLANASHVSLEHDYEVTGLEWIPWCIRSLGAEGVLVAHMTGGKALVVAPSPALTKDKVKHFKKLSANAMKGKSLAA